MVDLKKFFLNSRDSRTTKTVTFSQPFNSLCFETLSFFPFIAMQKSVCLYWGGEGGMVLPAPLVLLALYKCLHPFSANYRRQTKRSEQSKNIFKDI